MLRYIPYILMFAVMGALLYTYGLKRSQNQSVDLLLRMYGKCEKLVRKELKKTEYLHRNDIEKIISGVQVGNFLSKNRMAVTNPKEFVNAFLDHMIKKGTLQEETIKGKKMYCLKKQDK